MNPITHPSFTLMSCITCNPFTVPLPPPPLDDASDGIVLGLFSAASSSNDLNAPS